MKGSDLDQITLCPNQLAEKTNRIADVVITRMQLRGLRPDYYLPSLWPTYASYSPHARSTFWVIIIAIGSTVR